eukprot:84528-Prymnesium_polylepis.1
MARDVPHDAARDATRDAPRDATREALHDAAVAHAALEARCTALESSVGATMAHASLQPPM